MSKLGPIQSSHFWANLICWDGPFRGGGGVVAHGMIKAGYIHQCQQLSFKKLRCYMQPVRLVYMCIYNIFTLGIQEGFFSAVGENLVFHLLTNKMRHFDSTDFRIFRSSFLRPHLFRFFKSIIKILPFYLEFLYFTGSHLIRNFLFYLYRPFSGVSLFNSFLQHNDMPNLLYFIFFTTIAATEKRKEQNRIEVLLKVY